MLKIDRHDDVLVVTLDRGKVNALDYEALRQLIDVFSSLDPTQAVVLTGAGPVFSAGVDLTAVIGSDETIVRDLVEALAAAFLAVFDHPGPVVAAVNGAAIAGGCVLAASCDRRIVGGGPLGLAELSVGVPFPAVALEIVRGVVGPAISDLVLGARTLSPDEAMRVGLADELVEPAELMTRSIAEASRLNGLPAGVFALTKRQLQAPTRLLIGAHSGTASAAASLWSSPGVQEAIARYYAGLSAG